MKSEIVLKNVFLENEDVIAIPRKLTELITFFQDKVDEIDPEFHDSITIGFESTDDGYGFHSCAYEIKYSLPETDEETKLRIENEDERKLIDRTQKLMQYNKLQKELGLGDK